MPTAVFNTSMALPGASVAGAKSVTYDSVAILDESGAAASALTNSRRKFAVPYASALKFVYMLSNAPMTVKFSTTGASTYDQSGSVTLVANVPQVVKYGTAGDSGTADGTQLITGEVNPVGGAYITIGGSEIAWTLKIYAGYNTD